MTSKFLRLYEHIRKSVSKYGDSLIKRSKKTNPLNTLLFGLLQTQNHKSMDSVAADINSCSKNESHISRQSFLSRYNQLPISFFQNVADELDSFITTNYVKPSTYQILAVDGCDTSCSKNLVNNNYKLNKNSESVTALNLGIYNVTTNVPVAIEMVNHSDERKAFTNYMSNKTDYEKSIYVFDRGFDGTSYFKKLDTMKIKYVCRLRKNLKIIPDNLVQEKIVYDEGTKIRIIKYVIDNTSYFLATNLFDTDEFTVNKLIQIYHYRWTIEEKFKFMKINFHFGRTHFKNDESIKKSICCQIIIMKLVSVLSSIALKNKFGNKNNSKLVINQKTLTDGLYSKLLYHMFVGKLTRTTFNSFMKCYSIFITTNAGKHNPRTCVTPYMKWYIKRYFNKTVNGNND